MHLHQLTREHISQWDIAVIGHLYFPEKTNLLSDDAIGTVALTLWGRGNHMRQSCAGNQMRHCHDCVLMRKLFVFLFVFMPFKKKAKNCNFKVKGKCVVVGSLVVCIVSDWHLMAPFRAIYMVMKLHTVVVGRHQPLILSSELCKQTWLPEKHSVHISGSPTLEIRLNKSA